MNLGEIIRSLRINSGMTQKELADKLSISSSTIGMYEQGRREPDLNTISKIANVFNVTVGYLVGTEKFDSNHFTEKNVIANLSDRIKSLRLSANMTQTEFGEKFGIVKSTVSLYESGKSTPNDEIKKQICDYFGISLDYLLGREDVEGHDIKDNDINQYASNGLNYYINEETAKTAQEIFENKELRMLFDAARDADPEDLKALHNMALALKRKERGNTDDTGC